MFASNMKYVYIVNIIIIELVSRESEASVVDLAEIDDTANFKSVIQFLVCGVGVMVGFFIKYWLVYGGGWADCEYGNECSRAGQSISDRSAEGEVC